VNDVTGFVLTGGQSSRMGSDKALLAWGGGTLLERAIAIAQEVCGQVFICGAHSRYAAFGKVIEDAQPGRGPLSGIQAALHATQADLNLILSVDLPLMTTEFLAWLLQQARSGKQGITAPEAQGQLQPLCAVYHREVAGMVDEALSKGDLKVTRLFHSTPTRIIGEREIRAAGFESWIFTNVNTPEDYESLLQADSGHSMAEPRHE
jgi:molybdopterin-guanine dinucleotide biosynthesis protein A